MEAKKIKYTPIQRFWRLLKPDQKEIRNVYLYSIFKGLVSIAMPLGIQAIINFIQGGKISASWVFLVTIVIASILFNGVMQIMQLRIVENLQQKIFARAAFDFAYRIPRIKLDALVNQYAPELMNRFFDIVSVQKGLPKILIDFSTAVLHIFFGLVLLSLYHTFFVLFFFIIVILMYVLFKYTFRKSLNRSMLESKHKYKLVHWLEELARTSNLFKFASDSHVSLTKTDFHTKNYLDARESHFKVLVWQYSFMVGFKVLLASGLLIFGGILVIEGKMNIGQFVASEIILLMLMNAIEKVILSLDTIYDILTSLEKIGQVTDLELERNDGVHIDEICETPGISVELKDIQFKYPNQKNLVLDGINVKVNAGESLMITGANGSGKTTVLNVITGMYEQTNGQILFNGRSRSIIDLVSLRKETGEYLTNDSLFHGTVYENIELGRGVNRDKIYQVLRSLNLDEYVKGLPHDLDTLIGSGGESLPKSVVQKLILARLVCVQPKLLLLEDPLQYLDREDKKQVIDYLTAPENGWTLIAVSSDKYLARHCDQVVVLENGKIENNS